MPHTDSNDNAFNRLCCDVLQDTIVAIRKGGDKLVVSNLESDKYPTLEFSTDPNQACGVVCRGQ